MSKTMTSTDGETTIVELSHADVDRIARVLAMYAGETRTLARASSAPEGVRAALLESADRDDALANAIANADVIEFRPY